MRCGVYSSRGRRSTSSASVQSTVGPELEARDVDPGRVYTARGATDFQDDMRKPRNENELL
jgi:hypothetical protein